MRKTALLLGGLLLMVAHPVCSKEYKCPERVIVIANEITPVQGFENWSDPQAEFFISGIDLYEGHPHDKVQLKPDNADDPNEADGSVWTLADDSKDLWLVCRYSDTNARLIRQIDGHEKYCAVKDIRGPEDSTAGGGISLACK